MKRFRPVRFFATALLTIGFLTALIFFAHPSLPDRRPPKPEFLLPSEPPPGFLDEPAEEPPVVDPASVSFYAVGDNLIHGAIFRRAQQPDGTYDFTENYRAVKERVQSADIAVINQETVVNDYAPAEHYPTFSTPLEMLPTLIDVGFDVANLATNHMLDKGKAVLVNSVRHWQSSPIVTSGAFLGPEDQDTVRLVERNGIFFSFIGVTFGTNGIPVPESDDLLINLISDEDSMQKQIATAKEKSDFVIVMAHWGTEYSDQEDSGQVAYAQKLADWGADLIVGHHPHVIQPIDRLTAADGRTVYVAYSLGNFISAQDTVKRLTGAGLSFTVVRRSDGTLSVEDLYAEPLVTHAEGSYYQNICVYRLVDYPPELEERHTLSDAGWSREAILENFQTVMGEYFRMPE